MIQDFKLQFVIDCRLQLIFCCSGCWLDGSWTNDFLGTRALFGVCQLLCAMKVYGIVMLLGFLMLLYVNNNRHRRTSNNSTNQRQTHNSSETRKNFPHYLSKNNNNICQSNKMAQKAAQFTFRSVEQLVRQLNFCCCFFPLIFFFLIFACSTSFNIHFLNAKELFLCEEENKRFFLLHSFDGFYCRAEGNTGLFYCQTISYFSNGNFGSGFGSAIDLHLHFISL